MTDEVQGAAANQPATGVIAEGGDPNVTAQPSVADVETKRNADNLARARENGYVETAEPSIGERVNALVAGVQHAMDHNAPMTVELFQEMKALLGHREAPAAQ